MKIGDTVYVPARLLPNADKFPNALYQTSVRRMVGKKATVAIPGGAESSLLAKSKLYASCGIVVIRIGDFSTEHATLDPLAKSVTQFCRLLVDDASICLLEVRALDELGAWWRTNAGAYTQVVLVGHGAPDGIIFGVGGKKSCTDVLKILGSSAPAKTVLSLCCETGRASFSKELSMSTAVQQVVAPFHSVHSAVASQFVQTYLTNHLVMGRSAKVAWRDARAAVPGTDSFRYWKQGHMSSGANTR